MAKILILNGPNLNMLGTRQPEIYGHINLKEIESACEALANELQVEVNFAQTNYEGELVSLIQKANGKYEGIIINAGGYSHTSVAIRDSLALFSGMIIEVHISNIYGREEFRHTSMISSISNGVIVGLGAQSYNLAMRAIAESFLTE
ncbi:MAG: 3-dehydroquinate dehydratase [Alphaproteobacteria bacterium]|nr:type II 3-dehydroquinate dehydratase [Alphaproteobacteria bacterium]GIS15181.1 MAG: 3-dehydroquinate dehydratase [Alphaproteobacteria bacterium]